ncbi:hypothetical protein, partial [Streptosporangium sp. NPDC003464]
MLDVLDDHEGRRRGEVPARSPALAAQLGYPFEAQHVQAPPRAGLADAALVAFGFQRRFDRPRRRPLRGGEHGEDH